MRFVIYLAIIGAAVYLLIALIQARGRRRGGGGSGGGGGGVPRRPGPAPRGPIGPEDDPAFLAELERRRREAERRAREETHGSGTDGGGQDAEGPSGRPDGTGPGTA